MKFVKSNFAVTAGPKPSLMKIVLSIVLLINLLSGCSSVISNSENY